MTTEALQWGKASSGNVFEVVWYDDEMRIALLRNYTYYNFYVFAAMRSLVLRLRQGCV